MTKIEKLAKALDFRTETEYFDYCLESYLNGQYQQCRNLFKDLTKEGKKQLLRYLTKNYSVQEAGACEQFYFELL